MLFVAYPKCSTCQKARKWLTEHNLEFEDRDIKEGRDKKILLSCFAFVYIFEIGKVATYVGKAASCVNVN